MTPGQGRGYALPLHVETRGSSGPDLILLHGFGANSYTWRHWEAPLAREHRIHMVDMKGFGAAPAPEDGAYSPVDQADLIEHFVRANELERVTLVGHSYGGTVALVAALLLMEREPRRLGRLVLLAGAAYPQRLPRYMHLASVPVLGALMLRLVPARTIARGALRSTYHDPSRITRGQVDAYARPLERTGGQHAMVHTTRELRSGDPERWTRRYRELDVPALLLWGRNDSIVRPSAGRRLAEDLPDARLEIVESCGHVPQEECPTEALGPVLSFLAETRAAVTPEDAP